jgi:acetyltransferase-like isoleucine patch superfamily enzyme
MPLSLNMFLPIQHSLIALKRLYYTKVWGMDIHPSARFSLKAHLDKTNPTGIHIGAESYIAFGAAVLSHDMVRALRTDTWIGRRCFIGARSLILPGVRVGDGSIVAAGAVVTKDVPPASVVAGNPAQVVREHVETLSWGRLK